jgi:hypothetical protein
MSIGLSSIAQFSMKQKTPVSNRRRAINVARGATPLRLNPLIKNPVGDATGTMSQPHSIRARRKICDALYPDNGGDSGAGYSIATSYRGTFTLQL